MLAVSNQRETVRGIDLDLFLARPRLGRTFCFERFCYTLPSFEHLARQRLPSGRIEAMVPRSWKPVALPDHSEQLQVRAVASVHHRRT
jgi:hypothetical protein